MVALNKLVAHVQRLIVVDSGRVFHVDLRSMGWGHCVVSLSKTHYLIIFCLVLVQPLKRPSIPENC